MHLLVGPQLIRRADDRRLLCRPFLVCLGGLGPIGPQHIVRGGDHHVLKPLAAKDAGDDLVKLGTLGGPGVAAEKRLALLQPQLHLAAVLGDRVQEGTGVEVRLHSVRLVAHADHLGRQFFDSGHPYTSRK